MNKIIFAAIVFLLGGCNAAYIEAVNKQVSDGFRWVEIPCRSVKPDIPAITLNTPDGKQLVCNVLQKQGL